MPRALPAIIASAAISGKQKVIFDVTTQGCRLVRVTIYPGPPE